MNIETLALLNQKFKGKKTHAAAVIAICSALLAFFSGDATLLQALQLGFTGLFASTIRSGVANEVACLACAQQHTDHAE